MSEYVATVKWFRGDQNFIDNKYSRGHSWEFDGGAIVQASSSPQIVPLPMSVEANVDPEEAFIASLSSCHMLFFLSIAAKHRLVVESYIDKAAGVVEKDNLGKTSMTRVTLRPKITFTGKQPMPDQLRAMHDKAHELCFIANSVKTDVGIEINT